MHAYLVYHVALRMPMLIDVVAVDLHELLEDCRFAPCALDRKPSRIVEMTVDLSAMFIVRVLRPEHSRTDTTREVLHVKFHVYTE